MNEDSKSAKDVERHNYGCGNNMVESLKRVASGAGSGSRQHARNRRKNK